MKKLMAAALALGCLCGCLFSCADNTGSSSESTQVQRVSTNPLDEKLFGSWLNGYSGYRFQDNRKVSLIMDLSESIHFCSDGSLHTASAEIPKSDVDFDGRTIKVTHVYEDNPDAIEVFTLERTGESDSSSYDGEYKITSGEFIDSICKMVNADPESDEVLVDIDGETMFFTFPDFCDYDISDGRIEMFRPGWQYAEGASSFSYTYSISGDTLTMKLISNVDSSEIVLERMTEDNE